MTPPRVGAISEDVRTSQHIHLHDRTVQQNVLCTDELFRGTQQLLIEHAGALYRLRITQNNKLILTK